MAALLAAWVRERAELLDGWQSAWWDVEVEGIVQQWASRDPTVCPRLLIAVTSAKSDGGKKVAGWLVGQPPRESPEPCRCPTALPFTVLL